MANALKTLFGEIAQAIRDQNGDPPEVKYKPVEFPQKIADISGGGGSSADVRYVTFMSEDGSFEYGKKAVAVGDNCADPIARGVFSKPTKESTDQYTYTHYGWATTPNGAADPNWNKSITEDKTVYANFAAAVRYYTITYYDGSALLKAESLAYGAMPAYTPEKEDYSFEGWEPKLATVTGNASYYAQFSMNLTFAGASWSQIAEISEAGQAADYFKVGDERTIAFTHADGTVDNIKIMIAGFNHDNLADGSGKAGMSIVCKTLPTLTTVWNTAASGYFSTSALRSTLQEWKNYLPTALANVIKPVTKLYDNSYSGGTSTGSISCDLWPLSISELGWGKTDSTSYPPLGARYAVFNSVGASSNYPTNLPKFTTCNNTYNTNYWTRNLFRVGAISPVYVQTSGGVNNASSGNITTVKYCVNFGFCI